MRCQQQKKAFEAIELLVALTFQRGTKKKTAADADGSPPFYGMR
jgi:hypothetical protein